MLTDSLLWVTTLDEAVWPDPKARKWEDLQKANWKVHSVIRKRWQPIDWSVSAYSSNAPRLRMKPSFFENQIFKERRFHSEPSIVCSKVHISIYQAAPGGWSPISFGFCFMLLHKVKSFKLYNRDLIIVSFLCCSSLNWK
jgi:hypothetical protein